MDNSVDRFTKKEVDYILVELIVELIEGMALILNAVIIFISSSITIASSEWSRALMIMWRVRISSANFLVPSGMKPLPEPMFTRILTAVWRF